MRAYKLPDGEWIDLDHVQAISHMWRNCSDCFVRHQCSATLAFQKEKKQIQLVSFCDYGIYGEKRNTLEEENLKIAQRHYEDFVTAWSGEAQ